MRRCGTAAAAIIPVRVHSKRLPRKALLADSGRPLFLHTWERAREASCFSEVHIATDSDEVEAAAAAAGAAVIRTSDRPRTGSERCAEAAAAVGIDAAVIVDIQGDWPEIDPADLDLLTRAVREGPAPIATLATALRDDRHLHDPDVVKVVRARDGTALYFSRSPIPFPGRGRGIGTLRHIGVYGFTADVLRRVPDLPSTGLAETEGLEQLRFIENGIAMRLVETERAPWGIENERDYREFIDRLAKRGGQGA